MSFARDLLQLPPAQVTVTTFPTKVENPSAQKQIHKKSDPNRRRLDPASKARCALGLVRPDAPQQDFPGRLDPASKARCAPGLVRPDAPQQDFPRRP